MRRLQAYKFELMLNGQQQWLMRCFAGSCRYVFNKALALQEARLERGDKRLSYADMCKLLLHWKADSETHWLSETPSQALQQSLKDLDRAYQNFFAKRADEPCFKKKAKSSSFRYPQGCKLEQGNNRLFLPKLGWIRYRNSRTVLGTIKNVTVSLHDGKWFASIQTEREIEIPVHQGGAIGIDVGIVRFATLSDGDFVEPRNSFKAHEKALRKAQQAMSRKVKFSSNWKKAKAKVNRIHARIAHVRRDFLHYKSHIISKNHALICVEDLQIRNMSKSASGTVESKGRNVKGKSGLNKAILDQGWGEFRRQLDYKSAWRGGHLIAVNPKNTSRTCPYCGHVSADNRRTQALFCCIQCGYSENADVVGAINILRAGYAQLACQVSSAIRLPAAGTHRSELGANA